MRKNPAGMPSSKLRVGVGAFVLLFFAAAVRKPARCSSGWLLTVASPSHVRWRKQVAKLRQGTMHRDLGAKRHCRLGFEAAKGRKQCTSKHAMIMFGTWVISTRSQLELLERIRKVTERLSNCHCQQVTVLNCEFCGLSVKHPLSGLAVWH